MNKEFETNQQQSFVYAPRNFGFRTCNVEFCPKIKILNSKHFHGTKEHSASFQSLMLRLILAFIPELSPP
uniref:Uncharacterized protein n=1 Tax=Salix viminalis TaxID=40686 RepID=A0A6N2M0B5_SALVM